MRRDILQRKRFTRRALLLAGSQLALASGLAARLYQLQVVEAPAWRILADDNRIALRLLPPPRGPIADRFDESLALNRQTWRLVLVPEETASVADTLAAIAALIDLSGQDRQRAARETRRRSGFVPVTVKENLSWREVARIEVNLPQLPGVLIEASQSRHYPYGPLAAHVTGYVGAVSQVELTGDPLLELPGFRTGKNGVEKVFEKALRGAAGSRHVEVNAHGRVIRELARREGTPGAALKLTVDMGLQAYTARRLRGQAGSVVVLDLLTGDVLALVSSPAYDPNAFAHGISGAAWQALLEDPRRPLVNKAIAGQYSPGSTFKMVVALAALEAGIDPARAVHCPGHYLLGDHRFHCWRRWGHGDVAMVEALKRSCDVYFYDTARRVGMERIAAMARRFGFGEATGIELAGEREGLVPTRAWKEAVHGEAWQGGETLIAGIGQGYLLATPVQLAVMAARLGSGAARVQPRLVRGEGAPDRPAFEPLRLPSGPMALVQEAMARVVNDGDGGTAFAARIVDEDMAMAGKTGTVQVRRITQAERDAGIDDEKRPWHHRDHALFVAYAPLAAPRYACAVVVDHGGSGSAVAAPVARDVLREAQRRRSVRWSGGASPAREA